MSELFQLHRTLVPQISLVMEFLFKGDLKQHLLRIRPKYDKCMGIYPLLGYCVKVC